VPVVQKSDGGYKVTVGSVSHPMDEKHYIQWIELLADGKSYTAFLAPGAAPEAFFALEAASVMARAYCNLHGLWKS
jgi:superoxide reductase